MIRTITLSFRPDNYLALPDHPSGSGTSEKNLLVPACRVARIKPSPALRYTIEKKSVDARKKNDIRIIFRLQLTDEPRPLPPSPPIIKHSAATPAPVVIGFGPAGIFAALHLARCGLRPIVIERGAPIEQRTEDVQSFFNGGPLLPHSNVQFGEGGAGTFSDGKLYSGISDKRRTSILDSFIGAGAPEDIRYLAHPHIGTDRLRSCVRLLRDEIIARGGTILFNRTLDSLSVKQGRVTGINHCLSTDMTNRTFLPATRVLLAIGHSARDTFRTLHQSGISLEAKPFAVGVRIEHPQQLINHAQYGAFYNHPALSPASYKLVSPTSTGRSLYTFCMCPGGFVVAAATGKEQIVTNGMSNYLRNGHNANSAVLVSVNQSDFGSSHPLAGIEFQEQLEHRAYIAGGCGGHAPCQRVEDFFEKRPSTSAGGITPTYRPGVTFTDLHPVVPPAISATLREGLAAMNRKINGFSHPDALLTAVETRSSSPVRIIRNSAGCSPEAEGLYPCGEGAGYAGGIMSSAVDGMRCAEIVATEYSV